FAVAVARPTFSILFLFLRSYATPNSLRYTLSLHDALPIYPRQSTYPTQPIPRQGGWYCHGEKCAQPPTGVPSQIQSCIVNEPLGGPIPGDPNRAVPNYAQGCLYAAHWDVPVLTAPGHGGGADWNHQSFSQSTKLVYTGFGNVPAAHSLTEASNGLRPKPVYTSLVL